MRAILDAARMTNGLLVGIFLLTLIDLLFLRTSTTFFGNAFRMQGVFLLWLLLGWSICSSKIKINIHPLVIVSCLVAQFVLALLVDGGVAQRAVGSLGEPNALAAVVVFVWPFLFFTKKPTAVWIKVSAILLVLLIVFLSGSRSGLIAFGLQSVFILLSKIRTISLWNRVIICLFLLICSYALPFLQHSGPYEDRSDIWQSALMVGLEQPILGHGFGNTEYALTKENKVLHNYLQGSYVDSSHNMFLDWWVEGGIVGLGLLLVLIGFVLVQFVKQKKLLQLILLLGMLAALSFNPVSVVTLVAFWWVIGQSYSRS